MPIAVTEEHESLRRTAERWLHTHCPPSEPRGVAEAAPARSTFRRCGRRWPPRVGSGSISPRSAGGQGFTLAETAVVLEEIGHALFPGPRARHPARLRRPGPPRRGRCRGAGLLAPRAWPTAPSRAPWPLAPSRCPPAAPARRHADLRGTLRPVLGLPPGPARPRARRRRRAGRDAGSCSTVTPSAADVTSEVLPAIDGTRASAPRLPGRRLAVAPAEAIAVPSETRARSRPRAGRRRERRPGALVRRDGVGLRQGARAVRPAHRAVPGRQARAGRHARGRRAVCRGGLGCRRGLERGSGRASRRREPRAQRRALPAPSPSRRRRTAPRSASRSSVGSVSPGSTMRTSISSAPWPTSSS